MLREMIFVKFVSGRYVFSERSEITPTGGLGQWVLFGAPISKSARRGGDRRFKMQWGMRPAGRFVRSGGVRSAELDKLKLELQHQRPSARISGSILGSLRALR